MAKRKPVNYGEGECGYRFCDRPGKFFTKKKEDQKFCSDLHRVAEWNLQNPRMKKADDAKRQAALDLGSLPVLVVDSSKGINRNAIVEKAIKENCKHLMFLGAQTKTKGKRSFHYTRIERDNKRGAILRSTLELLMKCNPTTFEINQKTGSTRGGSDISEIRHNGFGVVCKKVGTSENGIIVSRFELTEEGKEKAIRFFQERTL